MSSRKVVFKKASRIFLPTRPALLLKKENNTMKSETKFWIIVGIIVLAILVSLIGIARAFEEVDLQTRWCGDME